MNDRECRKDSRRVKYRNASELRMINAFVVDPDREGRLQLHHRGGEFVLDP